MVHIAHTGSCIHLLSNIYCPFRWAIFLQRNSPSCSLIILLPPFTFDFSDKARYFTCIKAFLNPSICLNLSLKWSYRCRFSITKCSFLAFWPPWATESHCLPLDLFFGTHESPLRSKFLAKRHGKKHIKIPNDVVEHEGWLVFTVPHCSVLLC